LLWQYYNSENPGGEDESIDGYNGFDGSNVEEEMKKTSDKEDNRTELEIGERQQV
jgi:hypothetical protein